MFMTVEKADEYKNSVQKRTDKAEANANIDNEQTVHKDKPAQKPKDQTKLIPKPNDKGEPKPKSNTSSSSRTTSSQHKVKFKIRPKGFLHPGVYAYSLVYRLVDKQRNINDVPISAMPAECVKEVKRDNTFFKTQHAEFNRRRNLLRLTVCVVSVCICVCVCVYE